MIVWIGHDSGQSFFLCQNLMGRFKVLQFSGCFDSKVIGFDLAMVMLNQSLQGVESKLLQSFDSSY